MLDSFTQKKNVTVKPQHAVALATEWQGRRQATSGLRLLQLRRQDNKGLIFGGDEPRLRAFGLEGAISI